MATKPSPAAGRDGVGHMPGRPVPQVFMPPTARELHAQAVHRLQIGLLGLCLMLLLVGLANIIMDRARLASGAGPAGQTQAQEPAAEKNDPLADIGVVPSPDAARTPVPSATAIAP